MDITVCIKQVPAVSALEFDRETRTLRREGVRSEVSAFDLRALVKAVELRERHGGAVTVMTMGPPQAREGLLECLALGADRAIHLCDRAFAGADTLATARALAAALRRHPFDLVLCGRNSVDAETAQVGPQVAELLDLPQITFVRSLEIDAEARRVVAERETDAGFETVEASLPVLVSAAEDLAPERFAGAAERSAAAEKPIEEVTAAALGLEAAAVGAAGSPTWVLGLSEVAVERRGRMIDAPSPGAAADELVGILLGHGLFDTWTVGDRAGGDPLPAGGSRAGSGDVLVVGECDGGRLRRVTLELLGKASALGAALGGSVSCLLAGEGAAMHAGEAAAHGAGSVLLAGDPAVTAATDSYAALLCGVIEEQQPGIVLLPSTVLGRDVAPRVAARLGIGLTGDCVDLGLDGEGRLLQHKPAFGGTVVALIASRTRPEMATVRPGMLPVGVADAGRRADVVRLRPPPVRERVRVLSRRPTAEAAAALDVAEVVVGVGKGIGGPENLPLVEKLAAVLDAAICATRDVTDSGWLPKQHQVGLTGRAIAPKLYLAVALRGAFEHTVGVRRAGLVVAVNRSPKAPIFRVSDYGVAGDFAAIVPALIERLERARRERRGAEAPAP